MWSILLFGAPQILRDNVATQIPRRKNRALVFYLAAHSKPLTRDQILALFFIDHERSAAQQILRTMLHDLRKQLGDALIVQADTLALANDVFVDARALEGERRFNERSSLDETSLQLYRGDFLEGFTLADVPEFDDWVARERERFRALAIRGWIKVATAYENERAYAQALDALHHALTFDELNEEAQRHALRVQYLSGDRAGAIRRFEQLQKKLDEELGVPPMAETRAVYDAIVTDTLPDNRPATMDKGRTRQEERADTHRIETNALPFIGRARELEQLHEAAAHGKLIWLEGEPGIGKTRLAEEFIADAKNKDARVLRGAAHELEQNLPYQPIITALHGLYTQRGWAALALSLGLASVWWAELARLTPEVLTLFPNVSMPLPGADESRVWEALYQLLAHLAASQRVIFFVDDAQWADTATFGVLGYLARHASESFVLLVTARAMELPTPAASLLYTLTREERMARIEMNALSARDLETLAAELTPAHASQLAAWLNENTEGNPFFVNELLRFAYDNNVLKRDGRLAAETLPLTTILTPTIQNLIQSRLLRLNDNARRVLQCACVSGREFDFTLVERVAELSEDATLDALDELQRASLVRAANGDAYVFDHQLTMQYAYAQLGASRQRVLHRRVAEALNELHRARMDSIAGLIAQHFSQAGALERAAPFARVAGDHARTLAAWSDASTFYQLALQGETDDSVRARIFVAMGDAQFHKADFGASTESYRTGLQLAQANRDFALMEEALLALTQSLFPQARYGEAIAFAREMRDTGPSELAGAAEFAWGTTLAVESAHPLEAEHHLQAAEKLLALPLAYPTQITPARRNYQLAAVLGQRGNSAQAVVAYRAALELAQAQPGSLDITRSIMLYNNLAYHLHLLGEQRAAADAVRAGIQVAQEKGSTSHLPYLLSTSGEIALAQGDLDAAEKFFKQGLAAAQAMPIPERVAGNMANLGLVAKARGQTDAARALLSDARARADAVGNGHLAVRIRIWLAPLLSDADAQADLREARAIAEANGYAGLLEEIELLAQDLTQSTSNLTPRRKGAKNSPNVTGHSF